MLLFTKKKKTEYNSNIEKYHKMSQHYKTILFLYAFIIVWLVIFNMNI